MQPTEATSLPRIVAWGRLASVPAELVSPIVTAEFEVSAWYGVHDPHEFVWFASIPAGLQMLLDISRWSSGAWRSLVLVARWGTDQQQTASIANFVLRELEPDAPGDLLPALFEQIKSVAGRDGCLGCDLLAEVARPGNFLGITYWADISSFDAYACWAGTHAWREVIGPTTRHIPLRLLAQRVPALTRPD